MELTQRGERLNVDRIAPTVSAGTQREAGIGADRRLIFVSSTARDLSDYRKRVTESIERLKQVPSRMEAWAASPETPLAECMQRVKESDALVVVVAHCYGWVPTEQAGEDYKSITWLEVDHALELDKPVFAFIVDEGADWTGPKEQDRIADKNEDAYEVQRAVAKLDEFKRFLRDKVSVKTFKNPDQLGGEVSATLSVWIVKEVAAIRRESGSQKSRSPSVESAKTSVVGQPPALPQRYVVQPYTLLKTDLVGREPQLQVLSDWYESRGMSAPSLLTVFAMGGMGKSALAWKWFREVAEDLHPQAVGMMWWSFQGPGANPSAWIERTLAYVTGLDLRTISQMNEIEQEQALFAPLDENPFLIVMDGVERLFTAYHRDGEQSSSHGDDAQSRSLRRFVDPRMSRIIAGLTEARQSRILMTSRLRAADLEQTGNPIHGSQVYELRGLPDEEAVNLWLSLGAQGSPESLIPVFRAFGNFPLLIQALAATVKSDLRAGRDFDTWLGLHPEFSPFDLPLEIAKGKVLAYAMDGLSSESTIALGAVASFRGAVSYSDLNGLLVQAGPWFNTDQELAERLSDLEDRGLIGRSQSSGLYDCHPVVRHVAWERLDEDGQLAIRGAQAEYLALRLAQQDSKFVEADSGHEEDLVDALVALGRLDEAIDVVNERIAPFAEATGNFGLLARVSDRLSDGAGEISPAVPFYGAVSHLLSGRLEETISRFVGLHDALPDSALILAPFLSHSYALTGRLRDAERVVKQALAALVSATTSAFEPSDSDAQLKICMAAYGHVLALRGQFFQAERILESALNISGPANYLSPRREAALTALLSGRPDLGREAAKTARDESTTRYDEIAAMIIEANCAIRLGDADSAKELMVEAVREARETGFGYLDAAAEVALASAFGAAGAGSEARRILVRVLRDEDRQLPRVLKADAESVLSEVDERLGDVEASAVAAEAAFTTAWCDGPPFSYHHVLSAASNCLSRLGRDVPALPSAASEADSSDSAVALVLDRFVPRRVAYGRLERATVYRWLDQWQSALDESLKLYESLRRVDDDDLQKVSVQALIDAGTAHSSLGDAMAASQLFDKAARLVDEHDLPPVFAARAAIKAALNFDEPKSRDDELASYEAILEKFSSESDAEIRAIVTQATINRAITLGQLGRIDDAVVGYDKAVTDIQESGDPALQPEIYRALFSKLDMLLRSNRIALAESVCDQLFHFVREAEEDDELVLNWVRAYSAKAEVLMAAGRLSDAAKSYSELHERYGHEQNAEIQVYIVRGLLTRSGLLNQLKDQEEALKALRDLVDEYGDSTEPEVQDTVALALLFRSRILAELGKYVQALADCEELDARFATVNRVTVRTTTAAAFAERGGYLEPVGRGADRIAHYDRVVERFGNDSEPDVAAVVAAALLGKSDALLDAGRSQDALEVYDELSRRFRGRRELALQEFVALGLYNRGVTLSEIERHQDALTAYDELIELFRDAEEPTLREFVAMSLYNRGATFDVLGRAEDAVQAYAHLCAMFSDAAESSVRERVAAALNNQAIIQSRLGRIDDELSLYQKLLERFQGDTEPPLRAQVAMALYNQGVALDQAGRKQDAVDAYRKLISKFHGAQEPELRERVSAALVNQGATLSELEQHNDALKAYDELLELSRGASEHIMREHMALALIGRCSTLAQLDRYDDALKAANELVDSFRDTDDPALRKQVAYALSIRGALLNDLRRYEDVQENLRELLELFEDAVEPTLREQVVLGLNDAAWAAGESHNPTRKRSLLEQVVTSYGDDSSDQVQQQVSIALNALAWSRVEEEGDHSESLSCAVEEAIRAANLASETEARANALDTAGWASYLLGDLAMAEKLVAEAADLSPNDEEIAEHLDSIRVATSTKG